MIPRDHQSVRRPDFVSGSGFPGYLSSNNTSLVSNDLLSGSDVRRVSADYPTSDVCIFLAINIVTLHWNRIQNMEMRRFVFCPDFALATTGSFRYSDVTGVGGYSTPGFSGFSSGSNIHNYPASIDPIIRHDMTLGKTGVPDMLSEGPDSLRKPDPLPSEELNVLFVDGLPIDCTRREVSHLFRPFIGFKDIRVIYKEPRHSGDKALVLCFVEFTDAKCALTALKALQGYKFDDKKLDSPALKLEFVKFPFRRPQRTDGSGGSFR